MVSFEERKKGRGKKGETALCTYRGSKARAHSAVVRLLHDAVAMVLFPMSNSTWAGADPVQARYDRLTTASASKFDTISQIRGTSYYRLQHAGSTPFRHLSKLEHGRARRMQLFESKLFAILPCPQDPREPRQCHDS